jgi:phosphatidylglycerol:prolipoprotein diacylglycerol transferase
MIYEHNLSPVLINIFGLQFKYYSVAYILGFIFTYYFIKFASEKHPKLNMNKEKLDNLISTGILAIILGGRLGYVLFYNLNYFLHYPGKIFAIWEGGMSFHGAVIGGLVGLVYFCKKEKVPLLSMLDLVVVSAPVGLFFGRVANFINGELWGRPVEGGSWGIIFPSKDMLPRHPSQLYEAFLEGLVLFVILITLYRLKELKKVKINPGFLSGIGMIGYSLSRMIIENFREPDAQIGFLFGNITMGQTLSFPLLILGGYLVLRKSEK